MSDRPQRQRTRSRPHANPSDSQRAPQHNVSGEDGAGGGASGTPGGGGGDHGKGGGLGWKPLAAVAGLAALALVGYLGWSGGGADAVSPEEAGKRSAAYEALVATPGMALKLVAPGDVETAIDTMPDSVSGAQREQLKTDINQGRVKLAWLTLWDTHAEDGDILRFESSSSFPIDVMALNAKTTIAIPYPADGKVLVTGVKDGGGGITIALESGATQIAWPTMAPGDTLLLPVTQGY